MNLSKLEHDHRGSLKNCPFCGSHGQFFLATHTSGGVECSSQEDCPGRAQTNIFDEEHILLAIQEWNSRAEIAWPWTKDQEALCDEFPDTDTGDPSPDLENLVANMAARYYRLEAEFNALKLREVATREMLARAQAEAAAKQAKVDELMFEYCPNEMTTEQIAEYERHQVAVPAAEVDFLLHDIPARTVCPYRAECQIAKEDMCHHKGVDHQVPFSCASARAFSITQRAIARPKESGE